MQPRRRKNNLIMPVLFIAGLMVVVFKVAPKKPITPVQETAAVAESQGKTVVPSQAQAVQSEKPLITNEVEKPKKKNPTVVKNNQKTLSQEEIQQLRTIVKSSMASTYTAQSAMMAEWNRYSTDLIAAGWEPRAPQMNFKMGFLEPFLPNRDNGELVQDEAPERMSTDALIGRTTKDDQGLEKVFSYSDEAAQIRLEDYRKFCKEGCTAKNKSFEMIAVLPLGNGRYDIWTINSRKELRQVQDGLRAPAQD